MDKFNRFAGRLLLFGVAVLVILVGGAVLVSVPAFAQGGPARPQIAPDIAGEWRLENNEADTTAQPPLGDYLGIPFNDAGRQRADTTAESIWGTPEYQCRPHSAPHQWRGLGGARILKEQDPLSREVQGVSHPVHEVSGPADLHGRTPASAGLGASQLDRLLDRRVDREHAEGHDHAPQGRLPQARRSANQRHVRDDRVHHAARRPPDHRHRRSTIRSTRTSRTSNRRRMRTMRRPASTRRRATASSFAENGGSDRHHVPHFLPGQNTALGEWLKNQDLDTRRGGARWREDASIRNTDR